MNSTEAPKTTMAALNEPVATIVQENESDTGTISQNDANVNQKVDNVNVSFFDAPVSNTSRYTNLGWKDFCKKISETIIVLPDNNAETKAKNGQHFIRGVIKEGKTRSDKNLKDCCLAILDVDKPVAKGLPLPTVEETNTALSDTPHLAYTSVTPGRIRIIFPVPTYQKEQTEEVTRGVYDLCRNRGLNFEYAGESNTKSQPWFYGQTLDKKSFKCLVNNNGTMFTPPPRIFNDDGDWTLKSELERDIIRMKHSHNPMRDFIEQLEAGTIHQAAKVYAGWRVKTSDLSKKQIFDEITALVEASCTDGDKVTRWNEEERKKLEKWFDENTGEADTRKVMERNFFISAGELMKELEPINWQVNYFLEAGAMTIFYGPSDVYKSFCVIGMGLAIAHGLPWMGNDTKQGPVFYICGEGHRGVRRRVKAWHIHHGISETGDIPFYVSQSEVRLFDKANAEALGALIDGMCQQAGVEPALIIIDTFSRNFGGNENSNQDTATFFNNAIKIGGQDCTKILVHHTGHDGNKTRGASNLLGDFDARYKMDRQKDGNGHYMEGGNVVIKCEKMKDADRADDMVLSRKVVDIATGAEIMDGQSMTSLVLDDDVNNMAEEEIEKIQKENRGKPTKTEELFLDVLNTMCRGIVPDERGVIEYPSYTSWREEVEKHTNKTMTTTGARRHQKGLEKKGLVIVNIETGKAAQCRPFTGGIEDIL